ncbi:hypothetical protein PIB30_015333 [Stylosanthes scabra]|uniref:F-box domain-containing protein n=1 Tax=Stylosanthes scabra TaxID=79078 RepID=A0ABU6Q7Z6_9FABA|nr:hypothetical protein [Stylosanthes scabra]
MDLPLELLELIFQKITLTHNLMNCRATCRSWRKVANAVFTSELPLMLSLSPSKTPYNSYYPVKSEEPNLASLSAPWSNDDESSTVLTGTWPQAIDPSDIIRVQSVQGWLMFNKFHHVIDQDKTFCELSFFNPFSRARFKLPWLFLFSGSPCHYQVRVVFNSAPPGSEDFVVVFLCVFCYKDKKRFIIAPEDMKQRLAFIKFKRGSWIESILETNDILYDIVLADKDDKLYALTLEHETSVVLVLTLGHGEDQHDLGIERLVLLNTVKDTYVCRCILTDAYYKRRHQLAIDTSTGELLLVHHDTGNSTQFGCYQSICTKGFRVFKLERSVLRWCEVFDIGNRILLWDYTRVSIVSTKGLILPEQFKGGNCIFFCHANTLWNMRGEGRFRFQDHDMGVFFLADRTITHFPNNSSLSFSLQNMWFTPARPAPNHN